jgi:uncharacterized protein (TIGR00251 family)
MNIKDTKEGAVIEVFVKPKSKKFEMYTEDDEMVVRCTGEPVKGKVNKEIIKETTRLFGFKVEIISGFTSRQKVLLIRDATKDQIENKLKNTGV